MKYSISGSFILVFLAGITAFGQSTGGREKTAHKKPVDEPAAAPAGIVVPSWLPPAAPYQPSVTQLTDVTDTKLDVRFDYQHQYLLGTAVLTLHAHFYPQATAVLDAKGFTVKSVQLVGGGKADKTLTYKYDGRQLAINLDRPYPREQSYQVRITYVAKPNELPAGGSEAITAAKGLYFINPLGKEPNKPRQIWTQGETESSSCWFPTIDHPNQRMTQEITMTVEDQFKTLSNGLLVASRKNTDGSRTDTWRQSLPAAPYLTMMAVGDFAVVSDTWHGKAVDYYVEPKYKSTAKAVFGRTPEMLDFYSKKLGVEFPWEKYSQIAVRDYVSGAMENTTATVHGASIQATRRELLDNNYETSESVIAHELFHHWFGDYVTCESWSNLPLNESFADYSQFLWAEYKYGADAAALVQQQELGYYLEEAESKREPLIRYHYQNREDMFDRHSYQKGGRVLHMLRKYVGDDAFFTALNYYLTKNKYSAVEISKLRTAFEQTTGEDLMWFFDQWFLQRGHPELKISHSYVNGQVLLHVQQVQDTLFQPVFRLPVTVTVWQKEKSTDHRITITKADQTFSFLAADKPTMVKFDSEGQLLAQLEEERTQDELIFQFYHARNYLQKYEVLDLLQNKTADFAVSSLLRNALTDNFYAIRRTALDHLRGYRGPNANAVHAEVQRLASSDPSSAVRAQALITLAAFPNESYITTYQSALRDSSYLVEAAAIDALAKAPSTSARTQIAQLENTPNSTLLVAIANYYSQRGSMEQYAWFLRRLPDLTEADLYTYLQAFGTFMVQMPVIERDKGVKALETIARTHTQYVVRLGAYRGLLALVPSQPELKTMLLDIKSKETDERLKAFYNLM
ncbi:M1 family peptidase [Hymenobacter sp. HMF4947]|uniref:Aminopeptidase N n=1 Tax=Hymenobacter ginkgonis TaxID=2682976 RepID=A0A7K1TE48_9BACT|nr:M1 family aminopeptidase [Hymenobacter ginkgonis]MVN76665.1 M1 family peptidase [Hymenobacter ginkgonis]